VNPGFPELPSCSEALDLGHDHGDIGQLDFSSNLGGLARHELVNALEDRFFHGQDLAVNGAPVQCLLERGDVGVALSVHAQRVVPTPSRRHNVGPTLVRLSEAHGPLIYGCA